MSRLRKDPIVGRWIIISTERRKSPGLPHRRARRRCNARECPFCGGNESKTPPEIASFRPDKTQPNKEGWWVRVIPSKFPVLHVEGSLEREGSGIYDWMNGIGAHEIIIETPEHARRLEELPESQVEKVLWSYRDRILDLERDERLRYVLILKNQGFAAGSALNHTHSQIIATPVIPKRVKEKLDGAKSYYDYKERCIFCDIIRRSWRIRRGWSRKRDISWSSPLCREVPLRSMGLSEEAFLRLRGHHQGRDDGLFPDAPEYAPAPRKKCWTTRPTITSSIQRRIGVPRRGHWHTLSEDFHWHLEIMPRLTASPASSGSGFYINPTPPEDAAKYLREVKL